MKMESNIEKVTELINKGVSLKREQKYQEALECYIEAINLIPTNGNAYYAMGKLFYITGDFEKAKKAYYLAYKNEANCFNRDLNRHFGHACRDNDENYKNKYKVAITGYKISIQGTIPFADNKPCFPDPNYESMCERYGKDALKNMIKENKFK